MMNIFKLPKLSDIKNWSPEVEKKITEEWKNSEMWRLGAKSDVKSDAKSKKVRRIYSIDTPPPYVNAPIHIGQAITYCYMDFFARYRRMKGFDVLFPLGLDRNGIPIEIGAEKKYGVSPFKVSREEFLKYCKKLLEESSVETADSFAKLGISFTSYKEGKHDGSVYKTDSPEYRALTQETFIELYKRGLIYEDKRISNWDPKLRTTIADSEINYEDIESSFVHVKWKVRGEGKKRGKDDKKNKEIVIATTRPELIGTCSAVIYNPKDERYKHLKGKHAIIPLYNREVPIMPHHFARSEKGTGLVMMCAGGDLTDIQFIRETKIEPIIAVDVDGRMNEKAGFLKGLKVKEAREKIIERLKTEGLIAKEERITHRTPISERSSAEIEFIEMPELYLKQMEFKEEIRKIARKIKFYPESSREILDKWIDSINIDWPISRRRFYATPIPLWYSEIKGEKLVAIPPAGEYYEPWRDEVKGKPPANSEVMKTGKIVGKVIDKEFKDVKWTGETRVLDTWMDSSISELFILKYGNDEEFFKKAFPATLRPQGKEIVRTWLYYSLLRGYFETKKPVFKDVWIHQHIVDEKGMKMAKSLGNVIDPQELLKEFGGEAIRIWSAIEGDLSKGDLKCSKERIKAEVKTLNKILNVSRFILQFEKPKEINKLTDFDRLFIDYAQVLIKKCDESYEKYDFYNPALRLRNFLWEVFASHYLEVVKARAYNQEGSFTKEESDSAKYTLHYLLETFLTLIYPIIPQMTAVIMNEKGVDLFHSKFPEAEKSKYEEMPGDIIRIMEFNSMVWKKKQERSISLREPIDGIEVPKELEKYKKDLKAAHKL